MRKRIKAIARGKFEYTKPELLFSEKEVVFSVTEGEDYEGEFFLQNSAGTKLRGLVYSTNPRMEVLTSQFEGEKVRIRYQFHSYGLSEGLTEKGDFVIVCEQNESSLSFCVSVSRVYAESSIGAVKNLYDFSCLAKANWMEAFQLFYHKKFSTIIKPNERKESMIYRGITAVKPSNQNLEEFLIGIRKKEKIHFTIEKQLLQFTDVRERRMESMEVKKDYWGYLEIHVSADADFIQIEKQKICSEDFIGSTYNLQICIDPAYMHGGRNYGRIELASVYERIAIEVTADAAKAKNLSDRQIRTEKKHCLAKVMELYQDYRLKRIVTGVWTKETIVVLNRLHELEPEEAIYALMKAQCLITNKQKQDAEWILSAFKRSWEDKEHPLWGYYLYLMTLIEKEPNYTERLAEDIQVLFRENPDSALLFWISCFLEEEYQENPEQKLEDIADWIMFGCTSPYLYIEAFDLILQNPYLLRDLEDFELRILRWAVRQQVLTKNIVLRIFQIMETKKGFSKVLYELLCAAYELEPKEEYLEIICGYLICGQQFAHKYHKWYVLGIEKELRITSLYEAYLLSMDERMIESIPKVIQMYFQYESALPYGKMAVLYNNIIAAKNSSAEVYQQYSRSMSSFAMEQIQQGHIDDNLAVIYDDMLDVGLINEEIAKALANIIFTHRIAVYDTTMVRAIIFQKQMKDPQIVPIVEQTAYFQLYSKEYVLIFEDAQGERYSGGISYQIQALMDTHKYLERCLALAPQELPYLIAYFDTRQNYLTFAKEDKDRLHLLMFSEAVSDRYKARLFPEILRFYQMNGPDIGIQEYLQAADYEILDEGTRKYAIELLVDYQMFDLAYEKVSKYGTDQIGSSSKAALVNHLIDRLEQEEDELTINLALAVFRVKKYNDRILEYLCRHYNGPTAVMLEIWKAAQRYEINRAELSERILVQMMYADHMVLEGMPVFACFYEQDGNDLVTLAYISDCSQRYFVENREIHQDIFALIEARYLYHQELNDVCRLSLLKHYTEITEISNRQKQVEDELLAEFIRRNMYFAFYKRLHPSLLLKYHLYDKMFLEYRANPYSHVVLHYSRDEDGDDFIKEDMLDVYGGIFVKSFVMFFGESIQYYISEEYQNEVEVTESSRIVNNDVYNENDNSRYNLLNQMLISNTLQDEEELYQTMKQYTKYEELTKKVFRLLSNNSV